MCGEEHERGVQELDVDGDMTVWCDRVFVRVCDTIGAESRQHKTSWDGRFVNGLAGVVEHPKRTKGVHRNVGHERLQSLSIRGLHDTHVGHAQAVEQLQDV